MHVMEGAFGWAYSPCLDLSSCLDPNYLSPIFLLIIGKPAIPVYLKMLRGEILFSQLCTISMIRRPEFNQVMVSLVSLKRIRRFVESI